MTSVSQQGFKNEICNKRYGQLFVGYIPKMTTELWMMNLFMINDGITWWCHEQKIRVAPCVDQYEKWNFTNCGLHHDPITSSMSASFSDINDGKFMGLYLRYCSTMNIEHILWHNNSTTLSKQSNHTSYSIQSLFLTPTISILHYTSAVWDEKVQLKVKVTLPTIIPGMYSVQKNSVVPIPFVFFSLHMIFWMYGLMKHFLETDFLCFLSLFPLIDGDLRNSSNWIQSLQLKLWLEGSHWEHEYSFTWEKKCKNCGAWLGMICDAYPNSNG